MVMADLRSDASQARLPTGRKVTAALEDYESLPDANFTAALNARANADTAVIDAYFRAVPDAKGCHTSTEPEEARRAMRAWVTQPANNALGVRLAPLRRAIADLKHGLSSDKGDTACYPAVITDLQSLESATLSQLAAST
jgi:hypothetical protein